MKFLDKVLYLFYSVRALTRGSEDRAYDAGGRALWTSFIDLITRGVAASPRRSPGFAIGPAMFRNVEECS